MKKTFNFGKVDYTHKVSISVELREMGGEPTFTVDRKTGKRTYTGNTTPKYTELSICGEIWNTRKTDIVCGGQCLDTIAKYRDQLNNPVLFDELFDYWKKYHLNGMHAGTPEQEAAIKEWEAQGNKHDYTAACEMLKLRGLYEVVFTGVTVGRMYENELYKYGHAWIVEALPNEVVERLRVLLSEDA